MAQISTKEQVLRALLDAQACISGSELARRLAWGGSARAVGGAVGHNPISIMIPCHRVLGADGHLTGYAGGLDVKKYLLGLEGAHVEV